MAQSRESPKDNCVFGMRLRVHEPKAALPQWRGVVCKLLPILKFALVGSGETFRFSQKRRQSLRDSVRMKLKNKTD